MISRLRVCLLTLAFCFLSSLAHAQQFFHQCSTAPVALEARRCLRGNVWDPAAIVAALVPRGGQVAVSTTVPEPPSPTCGLDETDCRVAKSSAAGCEMAKKCETAGKSECAKTRQQCFTASDLPRKATEASLIDELIGVDYCIPDALRERLVIARELAKLAAEGPAPAIATPAFSDSPVVVTLKQQEEYLSYDLTAVDRVKARIFPFGIPPYQGRVQIPMKRADQRESAAIESETESEVVATEPKVVQHSIPIDCLLDEIVWQTSMKLRAGSPLRQELHPHRIGRNLARIVALATERAGQLIDAVAAFAPAAPAEVVLNAPRPIQLAGQPSVCCPFNPEVSIADLDTSAGNQRREFVDIDFLAVEEALATPDDSVSGVPMADRASGTTSSVAEADQWNDVVDGIVAAYAGALESEMELAVTNPESADGPSDVAADRWNAVVDEIVAAYAGTLESERELAVTNPESADGPSGVAADQWSDVVDEIVAAYAGTLESEMELAAANPESADGPSNVAAERSSEVAEKNVTADVVLLESGIDLTLERVLQEWRNVAEVVQSLSDRWSQRIATQPEANSVR